MRKYLYIVLAFLFLISCDIKENKEIVATDFYQKIYDNQLFLQDFEAMNIIETSTGGFIIYAKTKSESSNFGNVYLIKIDEKGDFMEAKLLDKTIVAPVPKIFKLNNSYYFFAMDNTSLEAVLVQIDENLALVDQKKISGATYPLAVNIDKIGNLVLLNYNREDRVSVVSLLDFNGIVSATQEYNVGSDPFDPEPRIFDHLIGTQRTLPFFVGQSEGGKYYFNGFINYSFSCAFFQFGQKTIPAIVQGYKDQKGMASLVSNVNNSFSISQFSTDGIKISPKVTLDLAGISSLDNIEGLPIIEFEKTTKVISEKLKINDKDLIFYAGTGNGNASKIYFYNEEGAFAGSLAVGVSNKQEVADLISTTEGAVLVLGTVYLQGKLPRLFLNKYSKKQLEGVVK